MQALDSSRLDTQANFLTDDLKSLLADAIANHLAPQVCNIDLKGEYPQDFLQEIGKLGAYGQAVEPVCGGTGNGVLPALRAIEQISATCLSTGFMAWCHNACAWYLQNTDNSYLREVILPQVARGELLAGTGLSNPMKHFADIEAIRITAQPCEGGYILNGMLPWVSNIDKDHVFAIAAQIQDTDEYLMAIVKGDFTGLVLRQDAHFIALEGTKTFKCIFRNVFVSNDWILAAPCDEYVERIKPGFILMQVGMGLGLVASCIDLIKQSNLKKAHVNAFLDDTEEELRSRLEELQLQSYRLAEVIGCGRSKFSQSIIKEIIQARITASELSLQASQSAMLHAGAIAYLHGSIYERKLRESYFVAIVTPALKHLRKLLAKMP